MWRSVTGSDGAGDVGALCSRGDGSDALITECKAITRHRVDCSRPHNCCFPQAKGGKYSDSVSCSDLICQSLIVCNSACFTNADLNVEIIPLTVLSKLWSLHMKICSHIWKASSSFLYTFTWLKHTIWSIRAWLKSQYALKNPYDYRLRHLVGFILHEIALCVIAD